MILKGDVKMQGVDGRMDLSLENKRADSTEMVFYIDAESHLVRRLEMEAPNPMTSQPSIVQTDVSDYRDVGGMLMPVKMSISIDGSPFQELIFEEIRTHPPIPDARFEMPEGQTRTDNW